MKYSSRIKPISHLASYEAMRETRALLKILALGRRQVEEGKAIPLAEAIRRLRARATGAEKNCPPAANPCRGRACQRAPRK